MLQGVRKEVIGDCTLYCGDSTELNSLLGSVGAVVTDPPYGMSYRAKHPKWKNKPIANDGNKSCLNWACNLAPVHSTYVFCRWDNLVHIPKPTSLITWLKDIHGAGNCYHAHGRQTEVIAFYPGPSHRFPKYRPTDVIKCPKTQNHFHPTEKPESLMRAIVDWTEGVVFDPFMGSGTTGVACAKMGRTFIGVELDQEHFDVACKRIENAYSMPDMFLV